MSSPYAERWDPRGCAQPVDDGWIGEDAQGVWCARHPAVALLERPALWATVARFGAGAQEMGPGDWEALSAFELEAKLTMVCAANRRLRRQMKPEGEGDER